MPKKGENIYKRKDGRWEGRYLSHFGERFIDMAKAALEKEGQS